MLVVVITTFRSRHFQVIFQTENQRAVKNFLKLWNKFSEPYGSKCPFLDIFFLFHRKRRCRLNDFLDETIKMTRNFFLTFCIGKTWERFQDKKFFEKNCSNFFFYFLMANIKAAPPQLSLLYARKFRVTYLIKMLKNLSCQLI